MRLKVVVAMVLGLGSMNSLLAAPLLQNILKHPSVKQKLQENDPDPMFTDFSGTWTSPKCLGHEATMVIENSIDYITINGEETKLGTMTTKSNSAVRWGLSNEVNASIQSAEWSADKKQIFFKSIGVEKSFLDSEIEEPNFDSAMHVDMDYGTMELENGQLKLTMKTIQYKDAQRVDTAHPICVFTKSQD